MKNFIGMWSIHKCKCEVCSFSFLLPSFIFKLFTNDLGMSHMSNLIQQMLMSLYSVYSNAIGINCDSGALSKSL